MQINGIGTGNSHNVDAHQVTNCIHEHGATGKTGGAGMQPASSALKQVETNENPQEAQFSLSAWLKNTFGNGKKLLQGIWGSSVESTSGSNAGAKDINAGAIDSNTQAVIGTATSLKDTGQLQKNPYFSAIQDTGRQQETLWEKVKVRFQSIASQLSNRFSGKNSFSPKQEQTKEDLSKHSRYREEDLEVDCVLTDDSYLLDSYDKKGEYSKLTTKK